MENRLRDLLLDIEDRIYQGTLGSVKVQTKTNKQTKNVPLWVQEKMMPLQVVTTGVRRSTFPYS